MNRILGIILVLFLMVLPATAAMAVNDHFLDPFPGETITALTSAKIRTLLKRAGFPKLANSWKVDGYLGWYKSMQCPLQQELSSYSTPMETSPGIFRSQLVVLTTSKVVIKQPDCEQKLPPYQRQDLTAAAFGNRDHSNDKRPSGLSDLFLIGNHVTDEQLNRARRAIRLFQQCSGSSGHCPIVLKYHDIHGWINKHKSLIRLNNILAIGMVYTSSGPDKNLDIVINSGIKNMILMQVRNLNGPINEMNVILLVPGR